mmetsp:Transcript_5685/g.7111  ORF Transcript_5685/g.7111 Transcript_5685/m.7111 type:complete len:188 (-) Transcript_5685:117-680(-)
METAREDLAFTILWSPLPGITWFIPFIGHMGIANSAGIASDFQGPYTVGDRGRMAFGRPTRALKIDISDLPGGSDEWDNAIAKANGVYCGRMHNICCDNCHSHVACALNSMNLRAYGVRKFDMVKLCFLVFFKGRFFVFWRFRSPVFALHYNVEYFSSVGVAITGQFVKNSWSCVLNPAVLKRSSLT